MKNLSGRVARKLQRRVNAGLKKSQTVLDAAVVDRCDFVEICCADALCLTEAMQQRAISSISLLRSEGVRNHDAQTREKLLGWFSEKRPQKAWFSPPVIAHQNDSARYSLRAGQNFRQFFSGMLQQSCNMVAAFIGNGLQSVPASLLSSCVNPGLSGKVVLLREEREREQSVGTSSLAISHI